MRAADPVHNVELRRNAQGHDSVVFAFPYRADIVDAVRAIPGRRFDWEAKEWWAPRADAVAPFVKGVLERHPTLSVAPDVTEWLSRAVTGWVGRVTAGQLRRQRATSSWTRSPASSTSRWPSWPPSAAGACGCRSRARWPRRCWRPRAPAWTRARCAAPRACRSDLEPAPATLSLVEGYGEPRFKLDINWDPETLPAFLAAARLRGARAHLPVDPYLLEPLEHYLRTFGVEPAANAARGAGPAAPRARLGDRRRPPLARLRRTSRSRTRTRLGGELRPFQRAGVAYVLQARRTFLADEQGLGKTVQALAALEADDAYPAVIVCPAGLKLNWRREIERWLPHRCLSVIQGTSVDPGRGRHHGPQLRDRPRAPRPARSCGSRRRSCSTSPTTSRTRAPSAPRPCAGWPRRCPTARCAWR